MRTFHFRALLFTVLFCVSVNVALASKGVSVRYDDQGVTIDYSALVAAGVDIVETLHHQCSGPATNSVPSTCPGGENAVKAPANAANTIRITGEGLYSVSLKKSGHAGFGSLTQVTTAWHQYVANLYQPDDLELLSAIQHHAPLYSFFDLETHFPVSIDALFNRPISDFDVTTVRLTEKQLQDSPLPESMLASEFMQQFGHSDNTILLNKNRAFQLQGSREQMPVYWFADRVSTNQVRVHYFTLYGYDTKHADYVALGMFGQEYGDHAIDRESIAVTFRRENSGWVPIDVTYAGHAENQLMHFKGCDDGSDCNTRAAGNSLVSWNSGATIINWNDVSKVGNHPIVYVAHGAHAQYPARGHYDVDHVTAIGTAINLVSGEPAGALKQEDERLRNGELIRFDLTQPAHAALAYSGRLIKGFGTARYRSFPFIRYPTQPWVDGLSATFEECVEDGNQSCRSYMRLPSVECYGIGSIQDAVSSVIPDTDNDGVADARDAFPNDATETTDLDLNGVGDNTSAPSGVGLISGTVLDSSNSPVAFAYVRLDGYQFATNSPATLLTRTNLEGEYQLPVDFSNLPDTFAATVVSNLHLSSAELFRNPDDALSTIERNVTLADCDDKTIQIARFPVLYHAGDDTYGGQNNAQFQREALAIEHSFGFTVPEALFTYENFRITFFVKGVDSVGSRFHFNNGVNISMPMTGSDGEFHELSFEGKLTEYLQAGTNRLFILPGQSAQTGDYDDFEFVNPVIQLF